MTPRTKRVRNRKKLDPATSTASRSEVQAAARRIVELTSIEEARHIVGVLQASGLRTAAEHYPTSLTPAPGDANKVRSWLRIQALKREGDSVK